MTHVSFTYPVVREAHANLFSKQSNSFVLVYRCSCFKSFYRDRKCKSMTLMILFIKVGSVKVKCLRMFKSNKHSHTDLLMYGQNMNVHQNIQEISRYNYKIQDTISLLENP